MELPGKPQIQPWAGLQSSALSTRNFSRGRGVGPPTKQNTPATAMCQSRLDSAAPLGKLRGARLLVACDNHRKACDSSLVREAPSRKPSLQLLAKTQRHRTASSAGPSPGFMMPGANSSSNLRRAPLRPATAMLAKTLVAHSASSSRPRWPSSRSADVASTSGCSIPNYLPRFGEDYPAIALRQHLRCSNRRGRMANLHKS